ncbi:BMP family ABC transporter substrate-binding protein [Oribacterium sp. WCC10]|uniref:BMP family ABC transporter substrate-binding protein n=1 Tax=Oribacterium sp. WCC10 TaxID=1855343 RepID=UPI0008F2C85F|nr:BMP family ABC transporter substrate-binding protein [Oribacterium sp. WCC10]SFG50479.1 nucleoside-binding protein [Oribacterium sp. WCC10]
MKRFKKIMSSVLLASIMMSSVACSSQSENKTSANATNAAETNTSDEKAAEANSSDQKAVSDIKVGFIFLHDENSTYDLNFIDAATKACDEAGVTYMFKTNIPEGQECYEAACELADAGCSIIFADSFGHEDYMIEAAKEYPEVQFCHATGTKAHTEGLSNYHNAFATIYEGRYLAGIAAGMKLNEMIESGDITADQAKMGYVGAYTYAEVISGYTSFFLGARSICPSATMEVTFTGSWYDETAEKEGANKLIEDGCVLISQHADSMGAPTACEKAGVPDVSYNGSTASACPDTFIVSSKIDWAPYFAYIIDSVENGTEIATDWTGTLETGSVVLTDLGTAAAEGTADAIAKTEEEMKSGSLHVFDVSTFTVDGETLSSYMADVDTDADYTPDTEVIKDGYFSESGEGFRSAPYFDLKIDGISLLDTAY